MMNSTSAMSETVAIKSNQKKKDKKYPSLEIDVRIISDTNIARVNNVNTLNTKSSSLENTASLKSSKNRA
jgi:hypothetical protein